MAFLYKFSKAAMEKAFPQAMVISMWWEQSTYRNIEHSLMKHTSKYRGVGSSLFER